MKHPLGHHSEELEKRVERCEDEGARGKIRKSREQKSVLFGIQSTPGSTDQNVPMVKMFVSMQLGDVTSSRNNPWTNQALHPIEGATSFRRGFLEREKKIGIIY